MTLRILVLFLFFLPGGARRSHRIDVSRDHAQQDNTIANRFQALTLVREAFTPGGFGARIDHRVGLQAGALRKLSKQDRRRADPRLSALAQDVESKGVMHRLGKHLFHKQPASSAIADPSKDIELQEAAQEVRDFARTFGEEEAEFADKWLTRVMATEDPKARLHIMDECFIDSTLDCQGLDYALRRFRMLLAPYTAVVENAKQHVRALAAEFDVSTQKSVEGWMRQVELGMTVMYPHEFAEECVIDASSEDCFKFEQALRDYKSAAAQWFQPENYEVTMPEADLSGLYEAGGESNSPKSFSHLPFGAHTGVTPDLV